MWPLLLVDGFLFWIFVSIFCILEFVWTANGRGGEGFLTIIIFGMCLFFFSNFNPFSFMYENSTELGIGFLSYLVIGLFWSLFMWTRACKQRANYYKELKDRWGSSSELQNLYNKTYQRSDTHDQKEAGFWRYVVDEWNRKFGAYTISIECNSVKQLIPLARDSKNRIISWMIMWPFDMIWRILSDFIINLWDNIFEFCKGIFQNISNRQFKNLQ